MTRISRMIVTLILPGYFSSLFDALGDILGELFGRVVGDFLIVSPEMRSSRPA